MYSRAYIRIAKYLLLQSSTIYYTVELYAELYPLTLYKKGHMLREYIYRKESKAAEIDLRTRVSYFCLAGQERLIIMRSVVGCTTTNK